MRLIIGNAILRPSGLLKRMTAHKGDVSEGNKCKLIARRKILNKYVEFYRDGTRRIFGTGLNDEESYDSEILRFAHASILINGPVGDKRLCWVDATKDPVELWLYNRLMTRSVDLNIQEVFERVQDKIL